MLELLLEHPLLIGIGGLAIAALAAFIWLQTAHKAALYSAIGILAATIIAVILCMQIETDRERIRAILDEVAAAVEANDHQKVLSYVHPNAIEGKRRVEAELPRYEFTDARVTRVKEITINNATSPQTAIAEFNVVVDVQTQGYQGTVRRFLRVFFMKSGDRWLVNDYEHFDPREGFRNTPATAPGAF